MGQRRGIPPGASLVIAYNVYGRLYNEVPILFVLALLSFRLRDGGWSVLGLERPASWPNTILIALAAAALRLLLGDYVIDPLTAHFGLPPSNLQKPPPSPTT